MNGTATSAAEITNVSKHGFWVLLNGEELLVPFAEFPWFKHATIDQLSIVEWPSENHLYWPQLDIDLSVESIRNPNAFPLVAKWRSNPLFEPTRAGKAQLGFISFWPNCALPVRAAQQKR